MKLRNKKTGEINLGDLHLDDFNSLAELNAEWEDYEEDCYFINADGFIHFNQYKMADSEKIKFKQIGNYFKTKEEAEQAVEKLKAWKRLQDAGVTFQAKVIDCKWYLLPEANVEIMTFKEAHKLFKDIDLVFGVKYNEGDN